MIVEDQTVVTLRYELRDSHDKGELMEIMNAKYPFQFLFGSGKLLPAFEENILGLKEGDEFEFVLKCDEAYGPPEEQNVLNIPKKAYYIEGTLPEGMLEIGQQLTVKDDQGQDHAGRVLEYDDAFVRMDFNHFMAGKDLHFKGAVLQIRKATIDEIIRKHHIPQS